MHHALAAPTGGQDADAAATAPPPLSTNLVELGRWPFETTVITRQGSALSLVGIAEDALVFCDEQDRKPHLCGEMRAATLMIRAMARTFQPGDPLRLSNLNIAISREGAAASAAPSWRLRSRRWK
jgi:hypothetical protein